MTTHAPARKVVSMPGPLLEGVELPSKSAVMEALKQVQPDAIQDDLTRLREASRQSASKLAQRSTQDIEFAEGVAIALLAQMRDLVIQESEVTGSDASTPSPRLPIECIEVLTDAAINFAETVAQLRDELDGIISGWNRAQRRGACDSVVAAAEAIVAGEALTVIRALVAEAEAIALGRLDVPSPLPPPQQAEPPPHPDTVNCVDSLTAAAAAPPN